MLFLNDAQMAGSGAVGYCDPDAWSRGQPIQRLNAGHLSARGVPRHRARDGLEGNRDGRKLRSPSGDRIVHGLEQQPCGVQVVERVGLARKNPHSN
ncbi:MAG: hypothetical protein QGI29_06480 [Pirellulales bacterium]|nr:hypothetical protein [Pirellulales bacterium]